MKFITDRQCGVVSPANVDIIPGGRLVDVIGWMMTDFAVSLNKNTNNYITKPFFIRYYLETTSFRRYGAEAC